MKGIAIDQKGTVGAKNIEDWKRAVTELFSQRCQRFGQKWKVSKVPALKRIAAFLIFCHTRYPRVSKSSV